MNIIPNFTTATAVARLVPPRAVHQRASGEWHASSARVPPSSFGHVARMAPSGKSHLDSMGRCTTGAAGTATRCSGSSGLPRSRCAGEPRRGTGYLTVTRAIGESVAALKIVAFALARTYHSPAFQRHENVARPDESTGRVAEVRYVHAPPTRR